MPSLQSILKVRVRWRRPRSSHYRDEGEGSSTWQGQFPHLPPDPTTFSLDKQQKLGWNS